MSAKKNSVLKQLTLNFGQKSEKLNQCKECGLFYNISDKEDAKMHLKFHNEKESVLKYAFSKSEKLVQNYSDGKCVVIETGIDSKQTLIKALHVLNYVDIQLGIKKNDNFLENPIEDELELLKNFNIKNSTKFYLFICATLKKIVGFCMAEQIEKAFRIVYLNENEHSFTCDEKTSENAICGISRIWVASTHRRKRIASRLLDCVRLNFLYVCSVKIEQIALSDPTQFGQAFAQSYFQTKNFLIYNKKI